MNFQFQAPPGRPPPPTGRPPPTTAPGTGTIPVGQNGVHPMQQFMMPFFPPVASTSAGSAATAAQSAARPSNSGSSATAGSNGTAADPQYGSMYARGPTPQQVFMPGMWPAQAHAPRPSGVGTWPPPMTLVQSPSSSISHVAQTPIQEAVPIFACHLGVDQDSTSDVASCNRESVCFEIDLRAVCQIDFLHIVPINISPPGLPPTLQLTGKTRPDMHTRPFILKLFAREAETAAENVFAVGEWTISGGIPRLDIDPLFRAKRVDYLAVGGDFHSLTMMVHGRVIKQRLEDSADVNKRHHRRWPQHRPVTAAQLEQLKKISPLTPDPTTGNSNHTAVELIFDDSDTDDDNDDSAEEEAGMRAYDALSTATGSLRRRLEKALPPHSTVYPPDTRFVMSDLRCPIVELEERKELPPEESSMVVRAGALVHAASLGELVECIFSMDATEFSGQSDTRQRLKHLQAVAKTLQACWCSTRLPTVESLRDQAATMSIESIGDDAVWQLAQLVVAGLQALRCDRPPAVSVAIPGTPSELDPTAKPLDEAADILVELTDVTIRVCRLLLCNEFTAMAFASCGGITLLVSLCNQQPPPPLRALSAMLDALYVGLRHVSLRSVLMDPPSLSPDGNEYEYSAYQTWLYLLANVPPTSPLVAPCEQAVRVCGAVELLRRFQSEAVLVTQKHLATLAEAAAWKSSADNNTSCSMNVLGALVTNSGDDDTAMHVDGSGEDPSAVSSVMMREAVSLALSALRRCSAMLSDFLGVLRVLVSGYKADDRNDDNYDPLVEAINVLIGSNSTKTQKQRPLYALTATVLSVLREGRLLASIATTVQLIEMSNELSAVMPQGSSADRADAAALESTIHVAMQRTVEVLSLLWACDGAEMLYVAQLEESAILWQLLVRQDSPLSGHLLGEFSRDSIPLHEDRYSLPTFGWLPVLAVTSFQSCERLLLALTQSDPNNDNTADGSSENNVVAGTNIDPKIVLMKALKRVDAVGTDEQVMMEWEVLEDLAQSAVGASVVARVYAGVEPLLSHLLQIVEDSFLGWKAWNKDSEESGDHPTEDEQQIADLASDDAADAGVSKKGRHNDQAWKVLCSLEVLGTVLRKASYLLFVVFWSDDEVVIQRRAGFDHRYNTLLASIAKEDNLYLTVNLPSFLATHLKKNSILRRIDSIIDTTKEVTVLGRFSAALKLLSEDNSEKPWAIDSLVCLQRFADAFTQQSDHHHMVELCSLGDKCPHAVRVDILHVRLPSVINRICQYLRRSAENIGWLKRSSPVLDIAKLPHSVLSSKIEVPGLLIDGLKLGVGSSDDIDIQEYYNLVAILADALLASIRALCKLLFPVPLGKRNIASALSMAVLNNQSILSALFQALAVSTEVIGWQRGGEIGSTCRQTIGLCVAAIKGILSNSSAQQRLVESIIQSAIEVPSLMISNTRLLVELMITTAKSTQNQLKIENDCEGDLRSAIENDSDNASVTIAWDQLFKRSLHSKRSRSSESSTFTTLAHTMLTERRLDIIALIILSFESPSQDFHLTIIMLIKALMAACIDSVALVLAQSIVQALRQRVEKYLHSSTKSLSSEELALVVAYLSRVLIIVDSLCSGSIARTVILCDYGIMDVLFNVLKHVKYSGFGSAGHMNGIDTTPSSVLFSWNHAADNLLLLALQCVTTVYLTVTRAVHELKSELPVEGSPEAMLAAVQIKTRKAKKRLLLLNGLLNDLSDAMTSIVPELLKSAIESAHWSLISQCNTLVPLLPASHVRAFLQSITASIASIEALAVRLWMSFEESYQQFNEVTDVRKNILSLSTLSPQMTTVLGLDHLESQVASAHEAAAANAFALKCTIDLAYCAHQHGIIPATSLMKALRSTMCDIRKLTMRYQRSYTMWTTDHNSSRALTMSMRDGIQHGPPLVTLPYRGIGATSIQRFSCLVSSLHQSRSSVVSGNQEIGFLSAPSASFEVRHTIMATSLKHLVELVGRIYKLSKTDAASRVQPLVASDTASQRISSWADLKEITANESFWSKFKEPLREIKKERHGHFRALAEADHTNLLTIRAIDGAESHVLHSFLRHGVTHGDDQRWNVYDASFHTAGVPLTHIYPAQDLAEVDSADLKDRLPKKRVIKRPPVVIAPAPATLQAHALSSSAAAASMKGLNPLPAAIPTLPTLSGWPMQQDAMPRPADVAAQHHLPVAPTLSSSMFAPAAVPNGDYNNQQQQHFYPLPQQPSQSSGNIGSGGAVPVMSTLSFHLQQQQQHTHYQAPPASAPVAPTVAPIMPTLSMSLPTPPMYQGNNGAAPITAMREEFAANPFAENNDSNELMQEYNYMPTQQEGGSSSYDPTEGSRNFGLGDFSLPTQQSIGSNAAPTAGKAARKSRFS